MIALVVWTVIVGGAIGALVSSEWTRDRGAPPTLDLTGTRLRFGDRERRT